MSDHVLSASFYIQLVLGIYTKHVVNLNELFGWCLVNVIMHVLVQMNSFQTSV